MVRLELQNITDNLDCQAANLSQEESWWKQVKELATHGPVLRPLLVTVVMFAAGQELIGLPVIANYLVILIKEIEVPIDPYWAAAIVALFRAVSAMLALALPEFRRRPVFIGCAFVMAFCLGIDGPLQNCSSTDARH